MFLHDTIHASRHACGISIFSCPASCRLDLSSLQEAIILAKVSLGELKSRRFSQPLRCTTNTSRCTPISSSLGKRWVNSSCFPLKTRAKKNNNNKGYHVLFSRRKIGKNEAERDRFGKLVNFEEIDAKQKDRHLSTSRSREWRAAGWNYPYSKWRGEWFIPHLNFDNVEVIDCERHGLKRRVKEALHIKAEKHSMNKDEGLELNPIWFSLFP